MNILLAIGILLFVGYLAGWMFKKLGIPAIIGYMLTGVILSPYSSDFISHEIIEDTRPLLEVCLAFIAFEVGGALKWSVIRKHEKEIISITLLASLVPFMLIMGAVMCLGTLMPALIPVGKEGLLILAILLGVLASSTAPAATIAVIHEYKSRGSLTETIFGVVALDDLLGVLLFSLSIALIYSFTGTVDHGPVLNTLYTVFTSLLLGGMLGGMVVFLARFLKNMGEGQWIVFIFSLMILCAGISSVLDLDVLLVAMMMGIIVVNISAQKESIFNIMERYTEELIFLFFFILSGLELNISMIPEASVLIVIYVLLRIVGKFAGAYLGALAAGADRNIRKYTAGGLIPQAGIVIGLVLSVYQRPEFAGIYEIMLATIMGATLVNELIGPVLAKFALKMAGDIKQSKK